MYCMMRKPLKQTPIGVWCMHTCMYFHSSNTVALVSFLQLYTDPHRLPTALSPCVAVRRVYVHTNCCGDTHRIVVPTALC